jgi:hypothetical protein
MTVPASTYLEYQKHICCVYFDLMYWFLDLFNVANRFHFSYLFTLLFWRGTWDQFPALLFSQEYSLVWLGCLCSVCPRILIVTPRYIADLWVCNFYTSDCPVLALIHVSYNRKTESWSFLHFAEQPFK